MMNDLSDRVWYVQVGSHDSARFVYYASEETALGDWKAMLSLGDVPCAIGWKLIDVNSELREALEADAEKRSIAYADFVEDEWISEMETRYNGSVYGFDRN